MRLLSQGASASARRAAYRALARTEHPDVSKRADAQERFAAIAEAYRVLGDDELRKEWERECREYAQIRESQGKSVSGAAAAAARGALDVYAAVELTRSEAEQGCTKYVKIKAQRACRVCQGKGYRPGSKLEPMTCKTCGGGGMVLSVNGGRGEGFLQRLQSGFQEECSECNGRGVIMVAKERCRTCEGRKVTSQRVKECVECPPGLEEGARMRVPGLGNHTGGGGRRGDLFVTVSKITPDFSDRFMRSAADAVRSSVSSDAAKSAASSAGEGVKSAAGLAFAGFAKMAIAGLDALNAEQQASKRQKGKRKKAPDRNRQSEATVKDSGSGDDDDGGGGDPA